AEVHDRVVTAIARRGGGAADDARLAHHAACAAGVPGGRRRAFELACRAARTATSRLADEEAADWFGRALDLAPPDDDGIADLLLDLGRCAGRARRVADARAAHERAWTLAAGQGRTDRLVAAALGLGEVVVSAGRVDAGLVRMLERTLSRLGPDEEVHRVRVAARLATELYWGAELPRARALAHDTVRAARATGDDRALASALAAAQFVLRGPDALEERVRLGRELTAIAVRTGDEDSELAARRLLVPDLLQTDPVHADAEQSALTGLATAGRRPLAQWYVLVFRALRATMAGAPDAAALVDRAHALGRRIHAQPASIYACGQRFALRDRLDRAAVEADLRRHAARYPVLSVFRCQLAVLLAETGRAEEAGALLDELTSDDCAALPRDSLWLANVGLLAEVAAALDHAGHAEQVHAHLTPYGGRIAVQGVPIWGGAVDRHLALTATTLRRWDEAETRFRSALRLHARWGATPFVARTLGEHAEMLRRRGGPGDRRRAAGLTAQAGSLRPGAGLPTAPAGGLTARESEVLALLADGASNKEIGRRLRLSVHTVERHVANLYLKIGARNRADATAYALRGDARRGN
uniref:helix-turn-helix transcriptional regulator n=1 Tax=Pseudonocardia nigra TaxID=1921578 RepID=UPI001C5EB204